MSEVLLEDVVMQRLKLNGEELGGLKRTWETAPAQAIPQEDMPCAYPLVGGVFQPALQSQGYLSIGRMFIFRVIVGSFDANSPDFITEGNAVNQAALPFYTRIHEYFAVHNRLHTLTLADLSYVKGVVRSYDNGLVQGVAPGGAPAAIINFTLEILMTKRLASVSIPYPS